LTLACSQDLDGFQQGFHQHTASIAARALFRQHQVNVITGSDQARL
jgi:hypothetical protein